MIAVSRFLSSLLGVATIVACAGSMIAAWRRSPHLALYALATALLAGVFFLTASGLHLAGIALSLFGTAMGGVLLVLRHIPAKEKTERDFDPHVLVRHILPPERYLSDSGKWRFRQSEEYLSASGVWRIRQS